MPRDMDNHSDLLSVKGWGKEWSRSSSKSRSAEIIHGLPEKIEPVSQRERDHKAGRASREGGW